MVPLTASVKLEFAMVTEPGMSGEGYKSFRCIQSGYGTHVDRSVYTKSTLAMDVKHFVSLSEGRRVRNI